MYDGRRTDNGEQRVTVEHSESAVTIADDEDTFGLLLNEGHYEYIVLAEERSVAKTLSQSSSEDEIPNKR